MGHIGKFGCTGTAHGGGPCNARPIAGTDRCKRCCGTTLEVQRAKGEINLVLRRWGHDDVPDEPAFLVLKMATITHWRQQEYEAEIARILEETGLSRSEALVGDSIVVDKDGSPHKVGEYIRGIVEMEFRERKLAADLGLKVVGAQVQERLTRVAENTARQFAELFDRVFVQLDGVDLVEARAVMSRELRAVTGVAA